MFARPPRLHFALCALPLLACANRPVRDAVTTPPSRPPPLRVLALGDSITQGRAGVTPEDPGTQSWRYPFWKELLQRGVRFDMVGGVRGGFEGDPEWPAVEGVPFDAEHESHWGWRLDEILALLRQDIDKFEVDVALVLLGGNDTAQGESIDSLWPEWEQLLEVLRRKNPRIAVVIGCYCQEWDNNPLYAQLLHERAEQWNQPNSPVRVVSGCEGWISDPKRENTDTVDWVHPNPRGDEKLSAAFVEGLRQLFPERFLAPVRASVTAER